MADEGTTSFQVPTGTAAAPPPVAAPAAAGTPDFMSFVPDAYKETPWVKEYAGTDKPFENLFNGYVNARELIGRKSEGLQVPTAESTPEQIAAWNKAVGVPEKFDGYQYTPPDVTKEPEQVQTVIKGITNDAFLNKMREAAHKAGLSDKQFAALAGQYDAHTVEQVKGIVAANETARANYVAEQNTKVKAIYGDKADSAHATAKEVALKVLPEAVRNTKDPEICLLAALNYIHEQDFKGDSVMRPGANAANAVGDVRAEIMKQRSYLSGLKNGFQNPEYNDAKTKLDALYKLEHDMKSKKE